MGFVGAVIVTNPPNGFSADRRKGARPGKQHGAALAPSRDYGPVTDWDMVPADSAFLRQLATRPAIIWGGNYFSLGPASKWLVWDKRTGDNGYADAELAWTNLDGAVRMFRHQWMGMLRAA